VEPANPTGNLSPPPIRVAGVEALRPSPFLDRWHKPVFILCLLCWIGNLILGVLRIEHEPISSWFAALFLLAATASAVLALGKRLPLQNVVATTILIAIISSAIGSLGAATGIPFGPVRYSAYFGEQLFDLLPWPWPVGWIFLIVNGRGVARLVMRPWRKTNF
jgi:uncharacterized membrane protein